MTAEDQLRVAVVTGASSGIGKAAAVALAAQGWRVIGQGRDPQRTDAAVAEIRAAAASGSRIDMIRADLSLVKEAARAAREIAALTDHVTVVINNAGGVGKEMVLTSEGNEATFAGNHLGHFVLTNHLLPQLRAAAIASPAGAVRIISVSSKAHEGSRGLDWNDLQSLRSFSAVVAYANSKLANLLFTRSLARRLAGEGIVAHAMHPGIVDSNFAAQADASMQHYFETRKDQLISPAAAADTLVWLATAVEPGLTTGSYYFQRATIATNAAAQDDDAAEQLWKQSEALVAAAGV